MTTAAAIGAGARPAAAATIVPPGEAATWGGTVCRLCGVGCGLRVGIDQGHPVAIAGDPRAPVSRGLACAKGYHAFHMLGAPDRLTRARIRRGASWREVPIAEAWDLIAERIAATLKARSPDAVALYGSAQWALPDAYVATKFMKGVIGSSQLETSIGLYAASAATAERAVFGTDGAGAPFDDIEQADTFVIWDANLAETDPVLFSRMLDRRRRDPAVRLIDVSTRTTRTAYAADRSILFTPDGGFTLASSVAASLVARGLVDRAFVRRRLAFRRRTSVATGAAAQSHQLAERGVDATWEEYVASLEEFAPERAQSRTGVPVDAVGWLAALYGDPAKKVLSVCGPALHRGVQGLETNAALWHLHLLVGKLASPGEGVLVLSGQPNDPSALRLAGANAEGLPGGTVTDAEARRRVARLWQVPESRIPTHAGRSVLGTFNALEQGDISVLWVQGTNPMASMPNADRHRRAAALEGRFIIATEAYPTATTDVADVILPAALWLEREAVYMNAERRLQYAARLVDPPGDAATDAWHMVEVARRLGGGALFPWDHADHVEAAFEELRAFHESGPERLPDLASLRRGSVTWPLAPGRAVVRRFETATDPAADAKQGRVHFHAQPDGRARVWIRAHAAAPESPDRAFPLWLTSGPVLEHWGSGAITRRIPTLDRAAPRAYVEVHLEDAQRLGVRHGESVRVVSRRGAVTLEVRVDYRAQPPRGTVFIPSFDEYRPAGRLLLDQQDVVSGQVSAGPCAVRIERLGERGTE